ncbi:OmpA family outer membrane protein [Myroides injenensis]|uniref:OmpA family outer membrane protein n=1 Tax=Myroides injenensis TaxID=1183151 RepID=UPI000287CED9|nr:OmpA family outer membrane protein [Myroides injenensis]
MKKNIYKIGILAVLTLFFNVSYGQNALVKKANEQIERLAYADAIKSYEKLVEKGERSTDILLGLASSFYDNGLYIEANHWYSQLYSDISTASEIEDINNYYR